MVRWLVTAVGAAAVVLVAVWCVAPFLVDDPLPVLSRHTPVRTWSDRNGQAVWYERTHDGEWRFPVKLAEIPPDVRMFTLNVEDVRFYEHGGVDYRAIGRALMQNLLSARVLSGASTVSMQVAGLAHPRGGWKWTRKFLQAARARRMERLHGKDEILEAYFNHLPYGGKIVGIRAAAEYYFGLTVGELTVAEASLLVGLPQAPNRFRPDRHPDAARRRQRLVLDSQVRTGKLSQAESDRIFASERLRYRDFGLPTEWEAKRTLGEWGFVTNRLGEIEASLCASVRRILRRRLDKDVRDAAAVVMDVRSGETRGYVGTMDFAAKKGGQVDAARAVRSAGSTLKPFIYLEALEGGLITPETPLLDAPLRYGGYAPGNFDGTYRGPVTATEALSQSLNTPVIRLLAALGEARVTAAFERFGLEGSVRTNGLALALGSAGYRLVDLTRAYCRLARQADASPLAAMLRTRPLPGAPELSVAWKTGTSNNLKDAWCFAYTPDWVVGVWYGNKDGKAADRLVGAEIAAPAAGEIMSHLYEDRPPPSWPSGKVGKDGPVPLRLKDVTAAVFRKPEPVMILSPAAKVYVLSSGETSLTLDLDCSEKDVYWFWNGVGLGPVSQQAFPPGRHRLVAVPSDPVRPEATVEFVVR